ncbi:hypothetical protein ACGFX8_33250 [Streptomyces sp. NPDC048362]|uniref:hypothetical protein n=1 Tax=Streptomyces sp. NPDC048362 TaxID=3365539 RepID=UPI00371FA75F
MCAQQQPAGATHHGPGDHGRQDGHTSAQCPAAHHTAITATAAAQPCNYRRVRFFKRRPRRRAAIRPPLPTPVMGSD